MDGAAIAPNLSLQPYNTNGEFGPWLKPRSCCGLARGRGEGRGGSRNLSARDMQQDVALDLNMWWAVSLRGPTQFDDLYPIEVKVALAIQEASHP